jgi:hypothetical protein
VLGVVTGHWHDVASSLSLLFPQAVVEVLGVVSLPDTSIVVVVVGHRRLIVGVVCVVIFELWCGVSWVLLSTVVVCSRGHSSLDVTVATLWCRVVIVVVISNSDFFEYMYLVVLHVE